VSTIKSRINKLAQIGSRMDYFRIFFLQRNGTYLEIDTGRIFTEDELNQLECRKFIWDIPLPDSEWKEIEIAVRSRQTN
jgi:hypothetical protein